MIISASYKTDIPTFYGEWFMNRLEAGYCKMVNPYNQQVYRIDLTPESTDGFVFWTKNIGPFLKYLPDVQKRGYPFIVQHTINGYPRELEFKVINYAHTIEHMKILAGEYGSEVAIWRYDPIIISSVTPLDEHQRNFEKLATALEGTTNEVVVSFAQMYKKTKRNVDWAANKFGFSWAEKAYLVPGIIEEAHCVDADRLEKVSHKTIPDKAKQKGNRKECGCFASKDIGEYDTCPHGCVYCYAVQNRGIALQRYKAHDPASEFLFPPKDYLISEDEEAKAPKIIPVAKVHKKDPLDEVVQEKLFFMPGEGS